MRSLVHFGMALTILTGPACAQGNKPLVVGPGMTSCTALSALPTSQIADVTTWAQGFLSGMNSYRWLSTHYQPLVLPGKVEIQARLLTYCEEHPRDPAIKGALALFEELEGE